MDEQAVREKVSALQDAEAITLLNRVISGFAAQNRELAQTETLRSAIGAVAGATGRDLKFAVDKDISNRGEAAKVLLLEFTNFPELRERLKAALETERDVLIEPVTTALIVAGIVILLQTGVDLKIKREAGKTSVDFSLEKKPTADSILQKFFRFFS